MAPYEPEFPEFPELLSRGVLDMTPAEYREEQKRRAEEALRKYLPKSTTEIISTTDKKSATLSDKRGNKIKIFFEKSLQIPSTHYFWDKEGILFRPNTKEESKKFILDHGFQDCEVTFIKPSGEIVEFNEE